MQNCLALSGRWAHFNMLPEPRCILRGGDGDGGNGRHREPSHVRVTPPILPTLLAGQTAPYDKTCPCPTHDGTPFCKHILRLTNDDNRC